MKKIYWNWDAVSYLGKSKFIKSFSIWIILIPIWAKILYNVNNVEFLGVQVNLSLPFNLIVFYMCSVLFGSANILYLICCPDIIKNYSNPYDFLSKGGNVYLINEYIESEEPLGVTIEDESRIKEKFSEIRSYFNGKKVYPLLCVTLLYFAGIVLLVLMLYENMSYVFSL